MLTYYALSLTSESTGVKQSGLSKGWSSIINAKGTQAVNGSATSSRRTTTLAGSSTRTTTLAGSSTHTTKTSALTKNITITSSQSAGHDTKSNIAYNDVSGGLSDEDETQGNERDEAIASPPKGKIRATSAVSPYR
jgi:hypothetical protein